MARVADHQTPGGPSASPEELERLRAVFDASGDAVFILDGEGHFLEVNRVACERYGFARDEMRQLHVRNISTSEGARDFSERVEKIQRDGAAFFETVHRTKDGRLIPTEVNAILSRKGDATFIIGICRDIADRKVAEAALRKREEEQTTILRTALDGFWITDRMGRFLEVNDAVCKNLGYDRDEMLRMSVSDIEAREGQDEISHNIRRIMEDGLARFEGKHRGKDGSIRDMEISVNYLPPPHDCFFAFLRDITARKRAEEDLKRTVRLNRVLLDAFPCVALLLRPGTREIVASNAAGIKVGAVPGACCYGTWGHREAPCPWCLAPEVWGTGKEHHIEFESEGTFWDAHWIPVSEDLYMHFAFDVTDQKRAEAEKDKLRDQLQQAMKMEAVGRLAGGVAHDFNNLLTAIIGNVSLAHMKLSPSDPAADMLMEANKAAGRAATLTQQLLAFSRKQIVEPKVLSPNELIADLHAMLVRLIREDIRIRILPGKGLGSVKVDPSQFQQVLVNLVVNARDAMPNGGKIVIETSNAELDDAYCAGRPYVKPGRFVKVAVSDTGHGMSEEVKRHIFEPFFTTKAKGSGTGLGLAMAYGAVKQAGGSIEVYSEDGKGTTFKIYLPRVEGGAPKPVKDDLPQKLQGGTETVLLVEDEDAVRNMCARILEGLGYRVHQASNGKEAIALSDGYGGRIDLLMTDMVMPGMNGGELATQLILHRPDMMVLFTSGYTEDVIVHHGVLDDEVSFLPKPYTPSALAEKIRELLDTAG